MKFKKGDKVKMVKCMEASGHNDIGDNEWACKDDSFTVVNGEYVFLEGYSGYFDCNCLEKI